MKLKAMVLERDRHFGDKCFGTLILLWSRAHKAVPKIITYKDKTLSPTLNADVNTGHRPTHNTPLSFSLYYPITITSSAQTLRHLPLLQ